MPTLIDRFINRRIQKAVVNQFNQAFFGTVGTAYTAYDDNADTYLEQGYLHNPIVYSVIQQKANKAKQIPRIVKRVKDESAKRQLDTFRQSTKWKASPVQIPREAELKNQAFTEEFLDWPMPKPNELQTWGDIDALYETFMNATGNFYLYMLKGDFSSEPEAVYVLPSHQMEIILKDNASMLGVESPISHYRLIEGDRYVRFEADDVIHIKLPNPEYGMNGEHLYGLSPLKAALRNIQSSNLGLDLNNDTMLNGGAFGFIHGMETPLTETQASSIKDRLKEMRASKEVLGKIQGSSAKIGFTQVRMSAKEMELFEYFQFDQKMICNALGWDDKLLNNDEGAKYDNVNLAEQRVVVNSILPSLQLFDEAMTDRFLPLFKGYQGAICEHDPSDLPEMQQDMKTLVDWLSVTIDKGVINRDTARQYLKLPKLETPEMEAFTVENDVIPLAEAIMEDFNDQTGNQDAA